MTDRPILFSGPMIRALLDGRKTQTRRAIKPQPELFPVDDAGTHCDVGLEQFEDDPLPRIRLGRCITLQTVPYAPGDRLWVRETWAVGNIYDGMTAGQINPNAIPLYCGIRYAATDARLGIKDRPSIHMPRWASRLTLIVTDVRVQRLQEISEADAEAEGAERLAMDEDGKFYQHDAGTHRIGFAGLWEHLHGAGSWDANPWVVALTFTAHHRNIDQMETEA